MDRLTERHPFNGEAAIPTEKVGEVIGQLADYEDIDTIERFREWAEADREGRLVVLPFRFGEVVHYIDENHNCDRCSRYDTCGDDTKCPLMAVSTKFGIHHLGDAWKDTTFFGTKEEAEAALAQQEERETQ